MSSAIKSKSPTIRRIMREAQEIANSPSPDYTAAPLDSDLFEWHFTLRGPPSSAYGDGIYHGRISLPPTYPLRPPNFRFVTPNGRFETNREICLSISGHHEETWQPAWGVRTAIVALRSFMETNAEGQLGGLNTTDDRRKRLATESRTFKCPICNKTNAEIIAWCEKAAREAVAAGSTSSEVEVPEELRMGFRDEMEKQAQQLSAQGNGGQENNTPTPKTGAGTSIFTSQAPDAPQAGPSRRIIARSDSIDSEAARLAEGFIQTVTPPIEADTSSHTRAQQYPRARPGQGVPQPTGRTVALVVPRPAVMNERQRQENDTLGIIDRAIGLVMFLLALMILKVLVT